MYNPYNGQPIYGTQQPQTMPRANPYMYGQPRVEIVKVNGKNGAEAYQLPANSSILLLDEVEPIVWLAQTDGAGYKTVTPYSIAPFEPEPQIDTRQLLARIEELERRMSHESDFTTANKQNNGKQYEQPKRNDKQTKSS